MNESYPKQPEPTPVPHTPVVYEDEKVTIEYKHVERDLEKQEPLSEKELNEFGKDKWELISAFSDQSTAHFYFKRFKSK